MTEKARQIDARVREHDEINAVTPAKAGAHLPARKYSDKRILPTQETENPSGYPKGLDLR